MKDGVTLFSQLHNLVQFTACLHMKDPVCYSNDPAKWAGKNTLPLTPHSFIHKGAVLSWVQLAVRPYLSAVYSRLP